MAFAGEDNMIVNINNWIVDLSVARNITVSVGDWVLRILISWRL